MYYIKDCCKFGIEKVEIDLLGEYFILRKGKSVYIDKIYVIKDFNEASKKALILYNNAILDFNTDIEIMAKKINKRKFKIDAILEFRRQLCSL